MIAHRPLLLQVLAVQLFVFFPTCRSPVSLASHGDKESVRSYLEGLSTSPEGSIVSFVQQSWRGETHDSSSLIVLNLKTGKIVYRRQLDRYFIESWYGMSWARDGKWFALSCWKKSNGEWGICRFDKSDREIKMITTIKNDILQHPLVHPNGDRILFRSTLLNNIVVYNLSKKKTEHPVMNADINRFAYAFSPDGSYIYYGQPENISRVRTDGKERILVGKTLKSSVFSISISASGKWLSYVNNDGDLFVTPTSKYSPRKIDKEVGFNIHWSPSEDLLVYGREYSAMHGRQTPQIHVFSPEHGNKLRQPIRGYSPIWVRKGRDILFLNEKKDEIWEYVILTHTLRKVFPR